MAFRIWIISVFVLAVLYPAYLNAGPPSRHGAELLSPVAMSGQEIPAVAGGKVVRRRTASVRLDLLSHLLDDGDEVLGLELFEDVRLDCIFRRRVGRSSSSYTFFGEIAGIVGGTFSLAVEDETMIANVRLPSEGLYQIRYVSDGVHEVVELDANWIADCNGGMRVPEEDREPAAMSENIVQAQEQSVTLDDVACGVDILVVYTPAARDAAGGTTAMQAVINLAIDESNAAYSNSGIDLRLRLVHTADVNYTESGSSATDLERLTYTDGYMDSVQSLRDTYGADLVCLLVDYPSGGSRGWLWDDPAYYFADYAFHVVAWDDATGYYSLAHEAGHNMGCEHATPESVQGAGLYSYSMGWRFDSNSYRTIMAYSPGTRIQHFSNPDVTYLGYATGVPIGMSNEAHNALSINNAASTVANWRTHTVAYPILAGDFEGDCDVDWVDLGLLCSQWLNTDCDADNDFCGGADFEGDGDVDIDDFARFAENWGQGLMH